MSDLAGSWDFGLFTFFLYVVIMRLFVSKNDLISYTRFIRTAAFTCEKP